MLRINKKLDILVKIVMGISADVGGAQGPGYGYGSTPAGDLDAAAAAAVGVHTFAHHHHAPSGGRESLGEAPGAEGLAAEGTSWPLPNHGRTAAEAGQGVSTLTRVTYTSGLYDEEATSMRQQAVAVRLNSGTGSGEGMIPVPESASSSGRGHGVVAYSVRRPSRQRHSHYYHQHQQGSTASSSIREGGPHAPGGAPYVSHLASFQHQQRGPSRLPKGLSTFQSAGASGASGQALYRAQLAGRATGGSLDGLVALPPRPRSV